MTTGGFRTETQIDEDGEREYIFRFKVPSAANLDPLSWVPDETKQHLKGSMKENLLAIRSFIDAAIQQIENRATATSEKVDID